MSHRRTHDPLTASPYTTTPDDDQDRFFLSPTSPGYTPVPMASPSTQSITQHTDTSTTSRTRLKLTQTKEAIKRWTPGFHWFVPTAMITVFLCGCLSAVAHHLFYSHLHGRPAENQLMMSRIGVAFAFFTKASLVGSVVLAYRQRVWRTLRRKPVSLNGLDALFQVVESPVWFFMGSEMFVKARVASLMALATWLIPLASVLAPGALTAQMREVDYPAPGECVVASLNFSKETATDWRARKNHLGYHLAFWNTTPPPPQKAEVDWYDQPSYNTKRLTTLSYMGKRILAEEKSPCGGFNCSYTTEFFAPWYNCTPTPFSNTPFDISSFIPNSPPLPIGTNYLYRAMLHPNETLYTRPYSADFNSSTYTNQGTFYSIPPVYLAVSDNTTLPSTTSPRWRTVLTPTAYTCHHQKALYHVTSSWSNSVVTRTSRILSSSSLPVPVSPRDLIPYREFAAYYSLYSIMRDLMLGDMTLDNDTMTPVTHTLLSTTRLFTSVTALPVKEFAKRFEEFYQDMVLGFMSDPDFVVATNTTVPCSLKRWENRYRYEPRGLWVGYSIVIFIAAAAMVVGAGSLFENGYCSDTTFSKVLVTTRNPTLDKIVLQYPGASLGGEPMPKELMDLKLQFGVIKGERWGEGGGEVVRYTAFGVEGEVEELKKGEVEGVEGLGIELQGRTGWQGAGAGLEGWMAAP
ncbi:hypothetical protein K440DRAFT_611828 [Wilcoxina mikolae CBS 423.85]|nr:hypothetical protein K440DRAFT_611828 [Wilcoxina mikolae CBS 423.85]